MVEKSIQQEIQEQLERLGLASTENDIGTGGSLDVDFDYDSSDNVALADSQEVTIFDAFALLSILEALPVATWEEFWDAAQPAIREE